ncbi:MAG: hypothetical protein HY288_11190 [Planctomycetia bacterium]|nr:hypothetical protein [Planctomycetia bacterium]
MKRLVPLILALAVVALASPNAWAQRPGRGGPGRFGFNSLNLLAQQSVQDELKLTEDQRKQVTEKVEKQRAAAGDLQGLSREERQKKVQERTKANEAAVAAILNDEQVKRFKQISLQQRGARAFSDPEVAQALGLSGEQKDRIKGIEESVQSETRGLVQGNAGGGDRQDLRKKIASLSKSAEEKLNALLTPEQQAKWKELNGEPFNGEIRPPQFRGGNRPGG